MSFDARVIFRSTASSRRATREAAVRASNRSRKSSATSSRFPRVMICSKAGHFIWVSKGILASQSRAGKTCEEEVMASLPPYDDDFFKVLKPQVEEMRRFLGLP